MNSNTPGLNTQQLALLMQLAQSRTSLLSLAQQGGLDQEMLWRVANREAALTTRLHPMPSDPGEHLLAAHAYAHPYLEGLLRYDPARLVVVDEEHSYTPRKILRRVLDHVLDHLNQIEQWLAWQQQGLVPTPTDGWATSGETLQEDLQPLSSAELRAWLWRIDVAVGLIAQRAQRLSSEQLDWAPPDGGWTLRQALRHLAGAEVYYAVWMKDALPDEPLARYSEANRRFEQRLRRAFALPPEEQTTLFIDVKTTGTAEQVAHLILAEERALLAL